MSGRAVRRHRRPGHSSPQARDDAPDGAGSGRSYEELYVEYAPAARGLALSMVPPDVADDIVAEAFARVLAAIRAGGGPDHAFRPYLLAAVRNLANDWIAARRRVTVIGDMGEEPGDRSAPLISGFSRDAATEAEDRAEARLIVRAFSRLPERWRTVLWHLEVEGKTPADVAPMFGLSGNGVSALAMRAREGLRQAYLQEHIGTNIPASCRACAGDLGAGTRGTAEPAAPGRHAGSPRALPGVPGPVHRAFRAQPQARHDPGPDRAGRHLRRAARRAARPAPHRAVRALAGDALASGDRGRRRRGERGRGGRHAVRGQHHAVARGAVARCRAARRPGERTPVRRRITTRTADAAEAEAEAEAVRSGSAGGTLTGSGTPAGGAPQGAAGPAPLTGTAPRWHAR